MSRRPGVPLKSGLRDPVDEAALRRIWAGVEARSRLRWLSRERLAVGLPALVLGATLTCGALALIGPGPLRGLLGRGATTAGDPGPLRLADGGPIPAAVEGPAGVDRTLLALSDGSRITVGRGARIEPLDEGARATFAAILVRGGARFDVRPGGPRRWVIECGLATVEVLGTSFEIDRTPARLRVSVDRGTVLVRGERVPGRVRRLGAGDTLVVADGPPPSSAVESPTAPRSAAAPPQAPVPAPPSSSRRPPERRRRDGESDGAGQARASWRELAEGGHHSEAFSALGADGVRRESARLGARDLTALADVARLSGHPAEAVRPLERVLAELSDDPQASLAAFALGRLELDALGRPGRAARAFAQALELGLPASLREDAAARLVEAHAKAGDGSAAEAAARAYARAFPAGRYAAAIRGWLSAP